MSRDGQLRPGDSYGQNGWTTGRPDRTPRISYLAPFILLAVVGVVLTAAALILAGRV